MDECGIAPQPADGVPGDALDRSESKRAAKRRRGREREARRLVERLELVERVASGESYASIAADLGKSESTVRERFINAMELSATVTEEARQLALMRLDHLLYQWWEDATRDPENEDHRTFLRASRATRQVLRILEQENRIQGLYKC